MNVNLLTFMEQKCPFINVLGHRCPIAILSYYKCCQRHQCHKPGCMDVIVNIKNNKYCQQHLTENRCHYGMCENLSVNGSIYCQAHTCYYGSCSNINTTGNQYCVIHQPIRCDYIDKDGHRCKWVVDHPSIDEHNFCQRHMCQYCDRDPSGSSCFNPINNDTSRYCSEHSSRCSFVVNEQQCQCECQNDEESCDDHRCEEYRCARKYVTTIPKKFCQYHLDIHNFLLHEFE